MDILLGEDTIWRKPFGLSVADRRQHVFAVGRTGTGKSTLLRNMMIQDLEAGRGCMLIDPHGDLAEELLDYVPRRRIAEVMYVAPADLSHPVGFNILERTAPDDRPLITASVVAIFERLWSRNWGPRSAYVLANVVAALLEYPPSRGNVSLLGVPRMLADEGYRARIVKEIRDPRVRAFWQEEFAGWTPSFRAEVIAPLQNKAGMLLHLAGIAQPARPGKRRIAVCRSDGSAPHHHLQSVERAARRGAGAARRLVVCRGIANRNVAAREHAGERTHRFCRLRR